MQYDVIIMRSLGAMCASVAQHKAGHGEVGVFQYRVMMAVVASCRKALVSTWLALYPGHSLKKHFSYKRPGYEASTGWVTSRGGWKLVIQ